MYLHGYGQLRPTATATGQDGHQRDRHGQRSHNVVGRYDTDGTPGISIAELLTAIDDHFSGELSIADLFEVIDAHFG